METYDKNWSGQADQTKIDLAAKRDFPWKYQAEVVSVVRYSGNMAALSPKYLNIFYPRSLLPFVCHSFV